MTREVTNDTDSERSIHKSIKKMAAVRGVRYFRSLPIFRKEQDHETSTE